MVARALGVGFLGLIACLGCTCLGCSAAPDTGLTGRDEGGPRAETAPADAAGPGREVVFRVKGLT